MKELDARPASRRTPRPEHGPGSTEPTPETGATSEPRTAAAEPPRVRLTVTGVPESVRPAAARARAAVRGLLSPRRLDDFESAVAEALANAIEHGTVAGSGAVTLEVDVPGDEIVATVRDPGMGRLPAGPMDLCASAGPDDERGRGLEIMRRLSDDVEVRDEAEGRVVRLRLRLEPSR